MLRRVNHIKISRQFQDEPTGRVNDLFIWVIKFHQNILWARDVIH